MLWLYLALIAYLINAVVFVIDKHLLSGHIPKHNAYAFGAAILSIFVVVLIPFGVHWYGWGYFLISILSGASFFIGLTFLYKCIIDSDVSVAATQTGTMAAIFTYILSIVILKDVFAPATLSALIFLVAGTFLLGRLEKHTIVKSILSGVFFGLSYVLLKLSFNYSDFINGLFWTRMGFVGSAIAVLLLPSVRSDVKFVFKKAPSKSKFIFIFNKALAGLSSVILYFAIRIGNVSIVNALLGLQFMFIFLLAVIFKEKISGIKEKLDRKALFHKLSGIALVITGLALLFLNQK